MPQCAHASAATCMRTIHKSSCALLAIAHSSLHYHYIRYSYPNFLHSCYSAQSLTMPGSFEHRRSAAERKCSGARPMPSRASLMLSTPTRPRRHPTARGRNPQAKARAMMGSLHCECLPALHRPRSDRCDATAVAADVGGAALGACNFVVTAPPPPSPRTPPAHRPPPPLRCLPCLPRAHM